MKVITAPEDYSTAYRSIFLAGSIEQDKAEKWQDRIIKALVNTNITILNPRRESWDATWVQAIENTQFREQVEWEIGALEQATKILMYFDPATKSPISLLCMAIRLKS